MPSCTNSSHSNHSKKQVFTDHEKVNSEAEDQTFTNQLDGLSVDLPQPPTKSNLLAKNDGPKQPTNSGSFVMKKNLKLLKQM